MVDGQQKDQKVVVEERHVVGSERADRTRWRWSGLRIGEGIGAIRPDYGEDLEG